MATKITDYSKVKSETFFERHGWKGLLAISVILGFFGVGDMIGGASDLQNGETVLMHSLTGTSWEDLKAKDPEAANLIEWKFKTDGASLLTVAILSGLVLLTGFRRGERWSWVALWAVPLWMALTVFLTVKAIKHPGYGTPVPVLSGSIFFVIWVASLALTFRKFFQR